MTQCPQEPAEDFVEAYLLGTLPEDESQRFEEHYFDCPVCLAQVEALQAVSSQLRNAPRQGQRPALPWSLRLAVAGGALAATLVVGFFVLHSAMRPQRDVATTPAAPVATPTPAGSAQSALASLADLALPPFHASTLRGESRNAHFSAGMKRYAQGDCTAAVAELSLVPLADEDARIAHFYAGVCRMHLGELDAADKSLRDVADGGDSPEQEAALYYLAQVALASNNAADARRDLNRTIALRGDFESRARAELAGMKAAQPVQ